MVLRLIQSADIFLCEAVWGDDLDKTINTLSLIWDDVQLSKSYYYSYTSFIHLIEYIIQVTKSKSTSSELQVTSP
ncbi:unnamed protein product [Ambrosiozyma monospora]|uniref:Unnamed protein product n=1 Tax=Ambrosiozyma monospora TaxID=43982 RepID=A0A9W6WL08_AMBMO|nr:unnamed protein product [Ambrosiozyma monospora]